MGNLEQKVAKRIRVSRTQKAILGTVALAGALSLALLAPNAMRLLKPLTKKISRSQMNSIARARRLLIEKKLLEQDESNAGCLKLTPEGQRLASQLKYETYHIEPPKKWDGKWRVLIFDIVERKRKVRIMLRMTLQHIGFIRLQDSVWVYPYPCEEFVALLKADFKVGYSLLYLIVEEMEGDARLRQAFHLSPKNP